MAEWKIACCRPAIVMCVLALASSFICAQTSSPAGNELAERARAAVQAKQYKTALELFDRIVEQNPKDLEARVWVARLRSWQQDYAAAERGYRDVLLEDPGNVEAELGLVDVLSWQKQYQEAQQRLEKLRANRPQDPEVTVRLGRLARWQGNTADAQRYYAETLALNPADPDIRHEAETTPAADREARFRLALGYSHDHFDFTDSANEGFLELAYRRDRATVLGRIQYQSKFGEQRPRYAFGTTCQLRTRTWVHGEFGWASSQAIVVPQQDATLELTQGLRPGLAAGGGYRYMNFRDGEVQVVSALTNLDVRTNLHLYLRYTPALTRFKATGARTWNHNGWMRGVWDANRTLSPYLLYAVGSESFEAITVDQLGRFAAHTYGGGAEVRMNSRQGFRAGYFYQRRTQARRQHSFSLSYFVDF